MVALRKVLRRAEFTTRLLTLAALGLASLAFLTACDSKPAAPERRNSEASDSAGDAKIASAPNLLNNSVSSSGGDVAGGGGLSSTTLTPPPSLPTGEQLSPDAALLAKLYPHRAGDRWEMQVTGENGAKRKISITILKGTSDASAKSFYQETRQGDAVRLRDGYTLDDKGIYFLSSDLPEITRIEPPLPLVQAPLTPNSSWSWGGLFKADSGDIPARATMTLTGPEPVRTPAGLFSAYRIAQRLTLKIGGKDQTLLTTQWYAADVGLIKQTTDTAKQKGEAVLLSYKVGP